MQTISDVLKSKRQQQLGDFSIYILEDGPADGKSAVRCVALDTQKNVLRCCFLELSADTLEYALIVLDEVYCPLRETEFDKSGIIGGVKCVIGIFDQVFYKVTGTPDPLVFRREREHTVHHGRLT